VVGGSPISHLSMPSSHSPEADNQRLRQTSSDLSPRTKLLLVRMIETLEDSDDVQQVYANFEITDEVLECLSA
jgi:transcriptional/translational regulatory protein YebC/TACO1